MNTTTLQIVNTFESFRMAPTPLDQFESTGKSILTERIDSFVSANRAIDFVMLGFPFKSTNNRDKVLGKLPDMAEQATMDQFNLFNKRVKEIYNPGVNVVVVSDGLVFNDILGVEDKTVADYKDITLDMRNGAPVEIIDLNDLFKTGNLSDKRERTMVEFGITPEKLEQEILMNPDVNYLYRGMIRFMMEELAIKEFPSGNQLQKAAKKLTRDMMFRNEAYSNLVRKEFSSHIRLSMHPSINNGAKFSFQLIPGTHVHHSAWHCALVINKDNTYSTMHKKDALALGLQLQYVDNRPYYFTEN